jgi:hypothetical protein
VGKGSNNATNQRVPIREKERIVNIAGRWGRENISTNGSGASVGNALL